MSIDAASKLNMFDFRSIDTQNVSEVTKQIFSNAQTKSVQANQSIAEKFDLSKFKRIDLGLEVYGKQITAERANQIAVRQAGLDIKLNQGVLANVQYLNTQAALSAVKDVTSSVNGKIHTQVNVNEVDSKREVVALPKSSNVFDVASLSKDKTGSNSSFYFQEDGKPKGETKEDTTNLSIFA